MKKSTFSDITSSQLESLDDTDCYASAWTEALVKNSSSASWGGRGKGGRGLSRRTKQPFDIVVENVCLEYVGDSSIGGSKRLLENATLKLISPHVYAMVGWNGCGKSSLLRRMDAGKIPGFPRHLSTLHIPQEIFGTGVAATPVEVMTSHHESYSKSSSDANRIQIECLEARLDALDVSVDENAHAVEEICNEISALEEQTEEDHDPGRLERKIGEALRFFGMEHHAHTPMERLSGGYRKKVMLAVALLCNPDLLMLDEPTNHLDILGILQLRGLIEISVERKTTILLVSHDVDLINDVATHVVHFSHEHLAYYAGNYRDFQRSKSQRDLCKVRQNNALNKQRTAMLNTIQNMEKQSRADKKKMKTLTSRRKKLEKHGLEKDEHGHRRNSQKLGTGIKEGSINSVDASTRHKLSHSQLVKRAETNVAPIPDKAVQFIFRNTTCTWGEPLIMLMDVGHGYDYNTPKSNLDNHTPTIEADTNTKQPSTIQIVKKEGLLFDCVDLCINEGSTTCLLGSSGSGKSTLLRILAGEDPPLEGKFHRALNVTTGYFNQHSADDLIQSVVTDSKNGAVCTALSLAMDIYPKMTEQQLRGEFTNFGLDAKQATTNVQFLSGGERCRLCLAITMLRDPQVLILDEPTNHLDVESVEALVHGLKKWNGTVIIVSHDSNLVRCLDGTCYVLVEQEGKLRRIPDGIDSYLKSLEL